MFNDCYNRPAEFPSDPPLPAYIYSVGEKKLAAGEISEMGALKNSFAELIWGCEGVGELTLFGQSFTLNPGDVFYYLPGESHRHRALSPRWTTRWIAFDGPLAEALLLSCRYPRHLRGCAKVPDGHFAGLREKVTDSDRNRVREISGILCQILTNLVTSDPVPQHASTLIKQCIEYVAGNLAERSLDLNHLADRFAVSPSTLTRLFREKMGVPPGRFIRDRRVQEAQILLKGTDLPVADVALKCGFADPSSFIRFVRRNLGSAPLAYRRKKE